MKIRADWTQYLHNCKKREMDIIFSKCPEKLFQSTLELGAGDGFQSTLLIKYALKLVSTELNPAVLKKENDESIEYRMCDAEEIDKAFDKGQFDMVFSSNLLEHVYNPGRVLGGIYSVLKDGGITIHVIPNPFWKFCVLLLHIPYICVETLEKMKQKGPDGKGMKDRIKARDKWKLIHDILIPKPHGVSSSNIKVFYLFSKVRWKKQFENAGLELIRIIKGPVASGYGFGLDRLRNFLEQIGLASEYIYVATKKGKVSCYRQYFDRT